VKVSKETVVLRRYITHGRCFLADAREILKICLYKELDDDIPCKSNRDHCMSIPACAEPAD